MSQIDFDIPQGEICGLIGPNGSGKSTIFKSLLGLLIPLSGEIHLFGSSPSLARVRSQIGYLPDQQVSYPSLTGREFLHYSAGISGIKDGYERKINAVASAFGLENSLLKKRTATYSKGMLQRLGLAQSLLHDPKILLLDEPFSGLDFMGQNDLINTFKELKNKGVTIFYSSHHLAEIEWVCDRVLFLFQGQIRLQGEIKGLIEKAQIKRYKRPPSFPVGSPFENFCWKDKLIFGKESDGLRFSHWAKERGFEILELEESPATLEEIFWLESRIS